MDLVLGPRAAGRHRVAGPAELGPVLDSGLEISTAGHCVFCRFLKYGNTVR